MRHPTPFDNQSVIPTINKRFDPFPSFGAGLHEYRIDFGPGYRIYSGRDGDRLVILLGGGTKKRQQEDIRRAQALWTNYKQRKIKGKI